jgi:polyhydroxyalkanoate synthase subunit PhaC
MADLPSSDPKAPASHAVPSRLGPRPLELHLGTAMWTWLSSRGALPLLMSGSLPWRPELLPAATELRRNLDAVAPEAFAHALDREIRRRMERYLTGVERYRRHPYRRKLEAPPAIWTDGTTRLLDFGATGGTRWRGRGGAAPIALFVPSLVNRAYILDLAEGNSFLRWLAGQGIRPLLVDWGRPGEIERGFDLGDFIAGRLERALDVAMGLAHGPVGLAGYCMGGNLALALAHRRPRDVRALALLATPWDFHADRPELARTIATSAVPLLALAGRLGELSTDVLQSLFYLLDPYLAPRKFLRFADFEPGSARERAFVALEDWLNDGVPLPVKVARECLIGWYGENTPGNGTWRVAGEIVDPREITCPTLVLVPSQDRIVPPASADALARLIPGAERQQPNLGHIGMMVSAGAEAGAWRPLADWLTRRLARPSLPSQVQQPYKH